MRQSGAGAAVVVGLVVVLSSACGHQGQLPPQSADVPLVETVPAPTDPIIEGEGDRDPADAVHDVDIIITAPCDQVATFDDLLVRMEITDGAEVVERVELRDGDGAVLIAQDGAAPTIVWDTTALADGAVELTAVAVTGRGEVISDPRTVHVANGADVMQRVSIDHQAGRISAEDFIELGLRAVALDLPLSERYQGPPVADGSHTWWSMVMLDVAELSGVDLEALADERGLGPTTMQSGEAPPLLDLEDIERVVDCQVLADEMAELYPETHHPDVLGEEPPPD